MTAKERITLLHTLCLWSLSQNEVVKAMVNEAYKSRTTKDRLDTNIPLSVQPWGLDGDKRRYWLVEGQNDTHFRVYRETDPHKRKRVDWFSVAGGIEDLRALAAKLVEEDGRKDARALSERMLNAIPRFEASEVKRKRREYRLHRHAAFTRPEPGFSLYEGRTRGKRLRYTFSDEEDFESDAGNRRSARTSARETSAAPAGPTVTASGRQVRSRATGLYGETLHSGQVSDRPSPETGDYMQSDLSEELQTRGQNRAGRASGRAATNGRVSRKLDSDEEEDATSWDGGDEDEEEDAEQQRQEEDEEEEDENNDRMELDHNDNEEQARSTFQQGKAPRTLIVSLRYGKASSNQLLLSPANATASSDATLPNGTAHNPLAGQGAPRQPEQHAAAAAAAAAISPAESSTQPGSSAAQQSPLPVVSNGVPTIPQPSSTAPTAQLLQAAGKVDALTKPEELFPASSTSPAAKSLSAQNESQSHPHHGAPAAPLALASPASATN